MLFKAFSQDLRASPLISPEGKQVPLLPRCRSAKSKILYGKSSILVLFSLKIHVYFFGLKSLKLCGLARKGLLHILREHLAHVQLCHMQSQCLQKVKGQCSGNFALFAPDVKALQRPGVTIRSQAAGIGGLCFIYYHAINLSDCQNSLFLMISRSSLYFRDDVIFFIMDQFYFCSVFKPGIHFRGITLRVAIYKSNNSLTFKAHLNLFYSPCYGLKHISIITFVLKKTQNKTNQQQLNRNAKQIIENPQRKQIKTPMCHPSPTLQVFFSFTSIIRCS